MKTLIIVFLLTIFISCNKEYYKAIEVQGTANYIYNGVELKSDDAKVILYTNAEGVYVRAESIMLTINGYKERGINIDFILSELIKQGLLEE